jgi:hypothetical protein
MRGPQKQRHNIQTHITKDNKQDIVKQTQTEQT